MADELVWEDPPPKRTGGSREWVLAAIAQLEAHPGKWALVRTYPPDKRGSANTDAFRKHGCQAVTRWVGDEIRVYARWPEVES